MADTGIMIGESIILTICVLAILMITGVCSFALERLSLRVLERMHINQELAEALSRSSSQRVLMALHLTLYGSAIMIWFVGTLAVASLGKALSVEVTALLAGGFLFVTSCMALERGLTLCGARRKSSTVRSNNLWG